MMMILAVKIRVIMTMFLAMVSLSGCSKTEQLQISGKTMGTYYSIKLVMRSSQSDSDEIKTGIDTRLEQIAHKMSTYRSDSEITRFNDSRLVNQPFPISKETETVINEALRVAALTDNALDITAGQLVNLWGFGPVNRDKALPPSPDEVKHRLAWTGVDKLKVSHGALIKSVPQLALDLSSIAKGYAVDVIAEYLESIGINDYLVDIGGEVRAKGKNAQDNVWRVAIEKPSTGLEQQVQRIIELDNVSVATSGDYRNYFDAGGVHYSHTIDPKTGYPIENGIASITVITSKCITADGFSTGLGVLGPERGIEIADKLNIAVFMIIKSDDGFEERYSKAFEHYLTDE